jgi:hypothetical protein
MSDNSCPKCNIPAANIAACVYALCAKHQLDVLLMENLSQDASRDQLVTQICTPHQPHVLGTPTHVSDSYDGTGGAALGAHRVCACVRERMGNKVSGSAIDDYAYKTTDHVPVSAKRSEVQG